MKHPFNCKTLLLIFCEINGLNRDLNKTVLSFELFNNNTWSYAERCNASGQRRNYHEMEHYDIPRGHHCLFRTQMDSSDIATELNSI